MSSIHINILEVVASLPIVAGAGTLSIFFPDLWLSGQ